MAWRRPEPDPEPPEGPGRENEDIDINSAFTREVIERREDSDIDQKTMYLLAGIPKNTYRPREANEREWTLTLAQRTAKALGLRLSEVIKAAEERKDDEGDDPWLTAIGGG